jgi:hypothetical protein
MSCGYVIAPAAKRLASHVGSRNLLIRKSLMRSPDCNSNHGNNVDTSSEMMCTTSCYVDPADVSIAAINRSGPCGGARWLTSLQTMNSASGPG